MLVCVFLCTFCTRDRGCSVHPVFPAPSFLEGRFSCKTSSASRCEITESYAKMEALSRQIAPDHRHEENRQIDRKPDAPQDRAQRRAIAEIGEDIGNPHDQEQ